MHEKMTNEVMKTMGFLVITGHCNKNVAHLQYCNTTPLQHEHDMNDQESGAKCIIAQIVLQIFNSNNKPCKAQASANRLWLIRFMT